MGLINIDQYREDIDQLQRELASLRAEVARLRAENAALRELVVDGYYEEFGDVQSEGAKKEVDRYWRKSTTKQRLEQINGEG